MVLALGIECRELAKMTGIELGELLLLLRSGRQFNEEDYLPDNLLVVQGKMKIGIVEKKVFYVCMIGEMGHSKDSTDNICASVLKAYKKMQDSQYG